MQFINSIFILGLLALAIPIVIHLLKNRKVQKLWLGSLRFLEEAQKAQRHRKNLREYLLLILRSMIIIALAFLFLRPYLGSKHDYSKAESATVLLIDVSGSMTGNYNNRSMFDAEKEKAKKLIKELHNSTNLVIASFADNVVEIKNVDTLKVAPGTGTDYCKAIKWAQNRLLASNKRRMNVIMLTDMQISGLPPDSIDGWSNLIDFHLYPILPSGKNNTGINTIQISEAFVGKPHHLYPEFCSIGEPNKNSTLQLLVNGKKLSSSGYDSEEGLVWKPEKPGWYEGEVVLENSDPWLFDNRYFFKVYANSLKSVLIVNGYKGKSKFTDASYFVKNVFESNENTSNKAIDTKVKNSFSIDNEDLVVFCDIAGLSNNETENYKKYIEKGGSALFFLGNQTDENKLNALYDKGVFPAKIKRLTDRTIRPVLNWNLDHEGLKIFNNRNAVDVSSIVFSEAFELTPHSESTILASLNNENPAIVEMSYGKGKIVVIANAASREWTDWPISRMFLPLVRELSYYLMGSSESKVGEVTTTCSILKNPSPGIVGESRIVANHNTKESLTEVTEKSQFLAALGIHQAQDDIIEETIQNATLSKSRQRENELSHYIVLLLLALLMAEVFTSYNLK